MDKFRISAVSYLNTIPYVYGLEHSTLSDQIDLSKDTPVECARKLISGEADIGLVPVVAMLDQTQWSPITDWGIAADGPVQSVLLVGDVPVDQMKVIFLDYQSKTSNRLLQILCDEHFQINVNLKKSESGYEEKIGGSCGGLLIGDRALHMKGKFLHEYDLPECWKTMTGLPFVFARWVSSRDLPQGLIDKLDGAFQFGMDQIDLIVKAQASNYPTVNLTDYLGRHIRYKLDKRFLKGLDTFIDKLSLVEQN